MRLLAVLIPAPLAAAILADSVSYTGVLSSSTDVIEETFTLSAPATIGLQTWGFGGGVNAAGECYYGDPDFLGCPPAGAPSIGGSPQCGDVTMTLDSLAAGNSITKTIDDRNRKASDNARSWAVSPPQGTNPQN